MRIDCNKWVFEGSTAFLQGRFRGSATHDPVPPAEHADGVGIIGETDSGEDWNDPDLVKGRDHSGRSRSREQIL